MMPHGSLLVWSLLSLGQTPPAAAEDYLREVKPILAAHCYTCHGVIKQKGDLRLDTAAFVRAGGTDGPAIAPGDSGQSLLVRRLLGQDGMNRMPPATEGAALKPAQIAAVRRWIDRGAPAPADENPEADPKEHWAFRVPVRPALPVVANAAWSRNPVDAFVAREHERRGLTPMPEAAKSLLLRRVTLDLIGLPPTADEIADYAADARPDAYERVVDRLLASPQYGERWGRHWMDVWRYSDWWGLGAELRNSQKHMWHWRDWIVSSLNADKGYDRMVTEMLAADELFPTDPAALPATGFLARHYFKFNRTTWLDESVEHTSKAFLGLTFNCAKCHDHKYDPISHADYYRFRAFFEPYQIRLDQVPGETDFEKDGVPRVFDGSLDRPTYLHVRGSEANPDQRRSLAPGLPKLLAPAGIAVAPVTLPAVAQNPGLRPFVLQDQLRRVKPHVERARAELANAKKPAAVALAKAKIVHAESLATALHAAAAADRRPHDQDAARAAAKAEKQVFVAQAEVALAKAELDGAANRPQLQAALAAARKALATPGETYTSLAGALKTPESNLESEASRRKPFPKTSTGRRSALARWIADLHNPLTARVAVNHLWARHFGQPLVPSVFDFGRKGTPPTHPELLDWLAVEFVESGWSMKHLHRLLVTSQTYRLGSSTLDAPAANLKIDPDNRAYWRGNAGRMEAQVVRDSLLYLAGDLDPTLGGPSVEPKLQEASKRRSLYFFHSANENHRFLALFDDADVLDCYRRRESIVPQQALALSNSKLALDAAEKIARRIPGETPRDFARAAFTMLLADTPNADELTACEQALQEWRQLHAGRPDARQRARAHLVHALLNHNDFIAIR